MSAADTSYMKEKPVLSLLLSMGIPMMLSMLINSLYNIVDGIFVARMSEDAMMAISLVYPVQNLLHSIAVGFGVGTNAVIAIFLGSRKGDAASSAASQGILLNLCHGLLFMVFGILFMRPFLNMFTSNETVLAYGMQYGIIVLCFSMIHTTELSFEKIFQSMGRMKTSMISLGSSCMINIILDPLLIFGIGPFPALGVAGAAVATVFAQMFVFILFIFAIRKRHPLYRGLKLTEPRPFQYYTQIIRIGLPLSLQDMLFSCCSMLIARFVAVYGDGAVAAQKVGTQVESLSWMAADGFMAAINAFISQNYGAGQLDRVKAGYRSIMKIVLVWGSLCTLLLVFLPGPIVRIFLNDDAVLPIGIDYLRIMGFSQLFMCAEITTAGAFGGLGNTLPPSSESILLTCMRIPLLLILTKTPLGLSGIWWSISISSILKGIVLVSWYLIYQRRLLSASASSADIRP